jgi:hypothetical protein
MSTQRDSYELLGRRAADWALVADAFSKTDRPQHAIGESGGRAHLARAKAEQLRERRINSEPLDFLLSQCFDESGRPRSLGSTAMRIIIETETPNESRTMFRVLVDHNTVGKGLTAVQAQLVTAEIIERLVLPRKRSHLKPFAN